MFLKFFFKEYDNNVSKSSESDRSDYFPLIPLMQKIELIYQHYQKIIQESLSDNDVQEWHRLFLEEQKHQFALIDKTNLANQYIDEIYTNTLRHWIYGIYGVPPHEKEAIVPYSLRASHESQGYKKKLDAFKNEWITKNSNCIKFHAIQEIKVLIESKQSENRQWLAHIKNKEGYRYIYDLYQQCTTESDNPSKLFDEIHVILSGFIKTYLNSRYQTITEYMNNENQFDFYKNILTENKGTRSSYELK
jgi:hypothetical protein